MMTSFSAVLGRLIGNDHGVSGRRLIGLAGPPGVGKSTLAQALVKAAGPQCCVLVPMDGFHLANASLRQLQLQHCKGAPETFDVYGFIHLLSRLCHPVAEETVYAPAYHRPLEEAIAGEIAIPPETPVVLVEGNYLLLDRPGWRQVRSFFDQVWYLDLDPTQRRQQLIARHCRHGRSLHQAQEWVKHTDDPNASLIEASRSAANWYIDYAALRMDCD